MARLAPILPRAALNSLIRRIRPAFCCRTDGIRFSRWTARATSPPSRRWRQATARVTAPIWSASAPTRRFCSRCLADPCGRGACSKIVAREAWKRGPRGLAAFFGQASYTARGWLEQHYRSPLFHALWAPWVLHTGLGPRERLFRSDVKGDRLRAGGGRRADRQGRRRQAAARRSKRSSETKAAKSAPRRMSHRSCSTIQARRAGSGSPTAPKFRRSTASFVR